MTVYAILLSAHVVTAILGVGQIAGTAIVARSTPTNGPVPSGTLIALRRLGLGTTGALVMMMLSGALLEYACGGAFHTTSWFRVSFVLALVLGALQGGIRRILRKVERAPDSRALRGVVQLSGVMCAVVAVVSILMELKPW
jgi:hypothetical protein